MRANMRAGGVISASVTSSLLETVSATCQPLSYFVFFHLQAIDKIDLL